MRVKLILEIDPHPPLPFSGLSRELHIERVTGPLSDLKRDTVEIVELEVLGEADTTPTHELDALRDIGGD